MLMGLNGNLIEKTMPRMREQDVCEECDLPMAEEGMEDDARLPFKRVSPQGRI